MQSVLKGSLIKYFPDISDMVEERLSDDLSKYAMTSVPKNSTVDSNACNHNYLQLRNKRRKRR